MAGRAVGGAGARRGSRKAGGYGHGTWSDFARTGYRVRDPGDGDDGQDHVRSSPSPLFRLFPSPPRSRWRAANAASSLLPASATRTGSASSTAASGASGPSSPLTSSASSSTNRSTTRTAGDDVDLVEAQLDPRLVRPARSRSPPELADGHELDERRVAASSRISARASDAGQSRGAAVRSAGPSSSSRRPAPPGPSPRARP